MITDAHGSKTLGDSVAVRPVAISDEIIRRFVPGKGIGALAGDPLRRWIGRHAERYQPAPLVPENDQHEEQLEADCRHDKEVHGGNACRMIAEKRLPSLRRPSPPPRHVLGDSRLSDLEPELQQLAVDARRAPEPVGQAHLSDQAPDLNWNLWTTATRARLPAPVQPETGPMPPDDRLGLDNGDGVQHRRKQAMEPDQKQSVDDGQFRL